MIEAQVGFFAIFLIVLLYATKKLMDTDTKVQNLQNAAIGLSISLADSFSKLKDEQAQNERSARAELAETIIQLKNELFSHLTQMRQSVDGKLESMYKMSMEGSKNNSEALQGVRQSFEEKMLLINETLLKSLAAMQASNEAKLEAMRVTVDEKLHATLEQRLSESFKIVSERLEIVHKGLGEMQSLAVGVGDLKRTLSGVKVRGIFGELQLKAILEQMLAPSQYSENVATKKGSNERVEFAVRLPTKEGDGELFLPIDSKFPLDDYERLMNAYEAGDMTTMDASGSSIETRIKGFAKDIRDKYIDPPNTTDFAVMFLPIEGLYAEALRRPGLLELLQREYKIVLAGPTTMSALLSSLQVGFKTLAIQKRTSEVWGLLGAVKTEFGKFSDLLEKTQKKLIESANVMEQAGVRTRAIERKLRSVESLPAEESQQLLDIEYKEELEE